jgi:putative transposase
MPEYRRVHMPGGTYFFTVVTFDRQPLFADPANVELLRDAIRAVRTERSFDFVAGVILPDHTHFIWTLPEGDSDYSWRIGRMKVLFTRSLRESCSHTAVAPNESRAKHGEATVWQRRFWEHTIGDERDLEHHFDYLHFNPVKHGLCACPHAWPASSFAKWVGQKVYAGDWCCACHGGRVIRPYPDSLDASVGE